jgi:hypothetical protein
MQSAVGLRLQGERQNTENAKYDGFHGHDLFPDRREFRSFNASLCHFVPDFLVKNM